MASERSSSRRFWVRLEAAAGASDSYVLAADSSVRDLSITVHPDGGGEALIEISCRHPDDIAAGNADWTPLEFGGSTDLTEAEGEALPPAVQGVRLTASSQPAAANLLGIV